MNPYGFSKEIKIIKANIEKKCYIEFTSCLANLYRCGQDRNDWHSDNEKSLGKNPIKASISLRAERYFHLKHKKNKNLRKKRRLLHGSLLVMQGETQRNCLHQIAKTKKNSQPRINGLYKKLRGVINYHSKKNHLNPLFFEEILPDILNTHFKLVCYHKLR